MKLLIKIPSRERPAALREVLGKIADHWSGDKGAVRVLISADSNDPSMAGFDPPFIRNLPISVVYGTSSSKVDAINRDIESYPWKWDVLLVLSDDLYPVIDGFDHVVRSHMAASFPDTDGCLWFDDGRQDRHCTVACMGRAYWERIGRVVYRDEYHSYFCDNEWTEVAMGLGRMKKVEGIIFQHDHPVFRTSRTYDPLLRRNQLHKNDDRRIYHSRKAQGFPA